MKPKQIPVLLLTVLAAGELAGSALYLCTRYRGMLGNAFVLHGIGRLGGAFAAILPEFLLYPMLWLLLFAVIGLTVCAAPAALALVFLHGMTLGAVLTGLYQGQLLAGLAKAFCFVMPYASAQTLLLLLAARESMRSSLRLTNLLHGRAGESCTVRRQLLRYLVLSLGLCLTGVMQAFWCSTVYEFFLH